MDTFNPQLLATLSSLLVGVLYWSFHRNIAALDKEIEKILDRQGDIEDAVIKIRERVIILEQTNRTNKRQ